jgi:sorbose reductase
MGCTLTIPCQSTSTGFVDSFISVTAAGICPDEPILERKPESVSRTIDVNFLGTYYAAQLVAAQMNKQAPTPQNPKGGSIVFVASIAAYVASIGQHTSDYCASKGAVVSLCKALGVELAPMRIRVNSISPGYVGDCILSSMRMLIWQWCRYQI